MQRSYSKAEVVGKIAGGGKGDSPPLPERMGFAGDLDDAEAAVGDAQAQIDLLEQALADHRRKEDNPSRRMSQPSGA